MGSLIARGGTEQTGSGLVIVADAADEQLGPYHVLDELGFGGMATVHRAELHGIAGFRKQVALKRLLPQYAGDPAATRAFLEEAKLASRLHHANIAQAFDCGVIDDTYFIAMELVPGPTVKQLLIHCRHAAGPIPVPIVIEILIQLCEALDYAHTLTDDRGEPISIIHRDVSPSNVIVSAAGVVKLIDFGIAKAATSSARTRAGVIKGKFGYLAPEYLDGHLDLRVDLFGLGVVAHEMLSGRRLFPGNDYETLKAVRERPIPRPSQNNANVTADLDDIVLTALQRDPDRRWQSARAMQVALRNASRQFGAGVSHRQIRDWIEWAFARNPRPNSDVSRVVHAIEAEPSARVARGSSPPPMVSNAELPTVLSRPSSKAERPTVVSRPTSATMAKTLVRAPAVVPVIHDAKRTHLGVAPPVAVRTSRRVEVPAVHASARPGRIHLILAWFVVAIMLGIAGVGVARAILGL